MTAKIVFVLFILNYLSSDVIVLRNIHKYQPRYFFRRIANTYPSILAVYFLSYASKIKLSNTFINLRLHFGSKH